MPSTTLCMGKVLISRFHQTATRWHQQEPAIALPKHVIPMVQIRSYFSMEGPSPLLCPPQVSHSFQMQHLELSPSCLGTSALGLMMQRQKTPTFLVTKRGNDIIMMTEKADLWMALSTLLSDFDTAVLTNTQNHKGNQIQQLGCRHWRMWHPWSSLVSLETGLVSSHVTEVGR